MEMMKNEWKKLVQNKILLISFTVIMFIPILYAAFFLKSVWDPYGKTGDLPVAVVNLDKSVDYQGKTLDVGDQLVSNLKKNDLLDWNFVSKEEAKKGMEDRKYYMVVTLPEDFSKNASTLLDETPKKMNITYETNGSLNYIGEVIGETAAKQLKSEVSANVTKAYAESIFDQIKTVGDGFTQAADGSKKLNDGSTKLKDGNKTITDNLQKLASSTITFSDGAEKLELGLNQYTDGVAQLDSGATKLNDGIGQLASNVGPLQAGVGQLNDGSKTLANGIGAYTAGVSQLTDGSNQLVAKNGELTGGVAQLNDGLNQLNSKVAELPNQAQQLNDGASALSTNLNALNTKVQDLPSKSAQLNDGAAQLKDGTATVDASVQKLSQGAASVAAGAAAIDAKLPTDEQVQALAGALDPAAFNQLPAEQQAAILGQAAAMVKGYSEIKAGVSQQLAPGATQVSDGLSQLGQSTPALAAGASQLAEGTSELNEATPTLQDGVSQLADGASQLAAGTEQLNTAAPALKDAVGQLSAGSTKVNDGVQQYTSGVAQLQSGASQLTANSDALNSGATALNGGIGQISGKLPDLISGVTQLNDGSQQLVAGTGKLAANSPQLNDGIGQLASGATQIQSGSGQLADGSQTLGDGLGTLTDGTKELSSKLTDGAKKVNEIKPTEKTYDMLASPDKLTHKEYSHVDNYGAALAPYVMSLALYVGALVFNFIFPIRKISMEGQSSVAWWLSKFSIGAVVAVAMAVIEVSIMLLLGLNVISVGQMYLMAIITALAYMFLVMFLAMTFDNPGRFLGMVLLIVQLGGAGGTFPMPLTNKFFNAIHPFLPMSHSIYGFREAISGGLGQSTYTQSFFILAAIFIVFTGLLLVSMNWLQKKHLDNVSQLDDNQKLQALED